MATFSEALDAMKNNGIVQLPDGSTYCLCSSTELPTINDLLRDDWILPQ